MSRWLIQRIKAMLLCIVYGILFVDTVNLNIKARNALNAMFVETVDTLVFVALTQHLIQSTMRGGNSEEAALLTLLDLSNYQGDCRQDAQPIPNS